MWQTMAGAAWCATGGKHFPGPVEECEWEWSCEVSSSNKTGQWRLLAPVEPHDAQRGSKRSWSLAQREGRSHKDVVRWEDCTFCLVWTD